MRIRVVSLLVTGLAMIGASAATPVDEAAARKSATEFAATLPSTGFKLREGHWCGPLTQAKSRLIQLHLYAGNEYRFAVGATTSARSLGVSLFDEGGLPVVVPAVSEGNTVALSFAPEASGPYYFRLEQLEGGPTTFCLIYSYK